MSTTTAGGGVAVQTASPASAQNQLSPASTELNGNGTIDPTDSLDSSSVLEEGSTNPTPSDSATQSSQEASSQTSATSASGNDPALQGDNGKTSPPDTSQSNTPDETGKNEAEEKAESEVAEKTWVTDKSIDLYCKKTGQSHAALTSFGYWDCPKCGQTLRQPDFKKPVDKDKDGKSTKASDAAKGEPRDFQYFVKYCDDHQRPFYTTTSEGPFDLAAARTDVVSQSTTTDPVFRVETSLLTSITTESIRYSSDVDKIKEAGILNNPRVSVNVDNTTIHIQSPQLVQTLRKLIPYYPKIDLAGGSLSLISPYRIIWLYQDKIEEYLGNTERNDTNNLGKKHLQQLLDFVKENHEKEISEERARHEKKMCTYDWVWFLYKPGSTVYAPSHGRLSAFVVASVTYNKASRTDDGTRRLEGFTVALWNLMYDGTFVGRHSTSVYIPPFEGERKITDLNVIPCGYLDEEDDGETRAMLINEGKLWYQLLRGSQVSYSGRLLDERKREFQGRVYVDSASFYNIESAGVPSDENPSHNPWAAKMESPPTLADIDDMGHGLAKCPCIHCHGFRPHPPDNFPWKDYDLLNPHKIHDLTDNKAKDPDHRYLLCDRKLFGFDLRSRHWLILDVGCCKLAEANKKAIESLVMEEDIKNMIKALINKYSDSKSSGGGRAGTWRADHIENKGEGQIFLLHGSPGVGKTYTAECIAEFTGRALLSLTCADIGTDEIGMERRLMKWFQLAEKWGAVMLIDEADVFLEKRQLTDLHRNNLVSVFLRCVEYYRGVLFLTTNRVGTFDDAFMSRIHVIIHYEALTLENRTTIWKQFFDKLTSERKDFTISSRAKTYVLKDEEVTDMHWNGREIRNAFQTAVALADYRFIQKADKEDGEEGPTLDRKDFEEVTTMMRKFKEYLKDIHVGADEDHRAFTDGSRAPVL